MLVDETLKKRAINFGKEYIDFLQKMLLELKADPVDLFWELETVNIIKDDLLELRNYANERDEIDDNININIYREALNLAAVLAFQKKKGDKIEGFSLLIDESKRDKIKEEIISELEDYELFFQGYFF